MKFENLGYLVYSRAIPLHMAHDLIGGMVRLTWRKCRGYIGQFRAVNSDGIRMVRMALRPHGAISGRDRLERRRSRFAQGLEALGPPAAPVFPLVSQRAEVLERL